jgi:hypothetical protein
MMWTYWFLGGVLISTALTVLTFVNNSDDINIDGRALKTIAVFLLSIGIMFGMSSCIASQHLFSTASVAQ